MRIGSLLVAMLVAGGCISNDPLAYRMMADYFPIGTDGNWWNYVDGEGRRMHVEVAADSVVLNRACKVLQRDYEEEFWSRGDGQAAKYVRVSLEINAEEIVVEERWRPWLELPLLVGNSWRDEFREQTVAIGDTILREVEISGKVLSRETVSVPAGEFEECYLVEIDLMEHTKSEIAGESSSRKILRGWYGGDVGLVRFEESGEVWELESYEVK